MNLTKSFCLFVMFSCFNSYYYNASHILVGFLLNLCKSTRQQDMIILRNMMMGNIQNLSKS